MMVESDMPLRRSRSFIWGFETHPPTMAKLQRLSCLGPSRPWGGISSRTAKSCYRIKDSPELGTHSPGGNIYSSLPGSPGFHPSAGEGGFLVSIYLWRPVLHKPSYVRLPGNAGDRYYYPYFMDEQVKPRRPVTCSGSWIIKGTELGLAGGPGLSDSEPNAPSTAPSWPASSPPRRTRGMAHLRTRRTGPYPKQEADRPGGVTATATAAPTAPHSLPFPHRAEWDAGLSLCRRNF